MRAGSRWATSSSSRTLIVPPATAPGTAGAGPVASLSIENSKARLTEDAVADPDGVAVAVASAFRSPPSSSPLLPPHPANTTAAATPVATARTPDLVVTAAVPRYGLTNRPLKPMTPMIASRYTPPTFGP